MAEFTDDLELQVIENTTKVGITPEQAGDILVNNEKLSYLLGFTQQQADDIEANNEKVSAINTLTSEQIADIENNNNKISYTDAELVAEMATKVDTLSGQTVDIQAALDNSSLPSVSNPFTTLAQLNAIAAHAGATNNPHSVNKDQVGLPLVDNTADASKPVSGPQQTALDLKANASDVLTPVPADADFTNTEYTHPATHEPTIINQNSTNRFVTDDNISNLNQNTAHRAQTTNPHGVTIAQVGGETAAQIQARVDAHEEKQANPHLTTKVHVGLPLVDNTADANKPVSGPQQTALDLKADNSRVLTQVPIDALFTDTIYEHPSTHPPEVIEQDADNRFVTDNNKVEWQSAYTHAQLEATNPHMITAADVGLGSVDNTSDVDKPISTATQAAIDLIEVPDVSSLVEPIAIPIAVAMAIALG